MGIAPLLFSTCPQHLALIVASFPLPLLAYLPLFSLSKLFFTAWQCHGFFSSFSQAVGSGTASPNGGGGDPASECLRLRVELDALRHESDKARVTLESQVRVCLLVVASVKLHIYWYDIPVHTVSEDVLFFCTCAAVVGLPSCLCRCDAVA